MADDPSDPERQPDQDRFRSSVDRKAKRRLRARGRHDEGVWHWLGMFGLIGWAVALPTIAGVALGIWLDGKLSNGISWTLTFLFLGVAAGCWHAWYWVRQERGNGAD